MNAKKMKDYALTQVKLLAQHWKALVVALITLTFFYVFMMQRDQSWLAWFLAIPPCLVIIITAWCRVTDMSAQITDWSSEMRKVGLTLAGSGGGVVLAGPFGLYQFFPSFELLVLLYGFAFSWFTTPNMVPWWQYISQGPCDRTKQGSEQ